MKVSKIDQVDMSVAKKAEMIQGVLYHNPNDGDTLELVEHIRELNEKAKGLYKVFCTKAGKKGEAGSSERIISMAQNVNKVLKKILEEDSEVENRVNNLIIEINREYGINGKYEIEIQERNNGRPVFERVGGRNRPKMVKVEVNPVKVEELVKELCNINLRNSLKKYTKISGQIVYIPDILGEIVVAMHTGTAVEDIGREKLLAFMTVLVNDYEKKKQIRDLAKSIEKQHVKVQIAPETELLQLSSASNPQKEAIFEYIKQLANADSGIFNNKIVRFRRLVLLYMGALSDLSVEKDGVLTWEYGFTAPEYSEYFSFEGSENIKAIDELKASNDTLVEKREQLETKLERVRKQNDRLEERKQLEESLLEIKIKIKKNKVRIKELQCEVKRCIEKENTERYRECMKVEGITEEDKFLIRYIQQCICKILKEQRRFALSRLSKAYLCKEIFKEYTAYFASKFVDMGKAVYHFAMPEVKELSGELDFGDVLSDYKSGITSFDYEMVKAEELRSRDIAVAVSFAINNFANAFAARGSQNEQKEADVLQTSIEDFKAKTDLICGIWKALQFFGGKSKFADEELTLLNAETLPFELNKQLYSLRNQNFHFTESLTSDISDKDNQISVLLEHDINGMGKIIRQKYYSNNTPMFYKMEDLCKLMTSLYGKASIRPAQIPAFNRIVNKANLRSFLDEILTANARGQILGNTDVSQKYNASIFFILKDIYYYGFLQCPTLKERFIKALSSISGEHSMAVEDFTKRLNQLDPELSFGELCQFFMTEYSRQNPKREKRQIQGKKKEIYQHFRMVLYDGIKKAFATYLREEQVLAFIKSPQVQKTDMSALTFDCFLPEWNASDYADISELVAKDKSLTAWYVLGHFITPRQLNFLLGSIKKYISYVNGIYSRASSIENHDNIKVEEKVKYYEKVIRILQLCMVYSGQISEEFTDYFKDEAEYDRFMQTFIDIRGAGVRSIKEFCGLDLEEDAVSTNKFKAILRNMGESASRVGIYYDDVNPKVIRGVILTKLFGNAPKIGKNYNRVNFDSIKNYHKLAGELSTVFARGVCENESEQEKLKEFQNLKNRVELLDVQKLSELTNDMLARLIKWCYMRERDLMFFQLGIQYLRLKYGNITDSKYLCIKGKDGNFSINSGAILYQIMSIYTYTLPTIVEVDTEGFATEIMDNQTPGVKITKGFSKYCSGWEEYNRCLGLFEVLERKGSDGKKVDMHKDIINMRNYIDHFKYYTSDKYSILDMYGYIYDNFFTYDRKFKNSVPLLLKSILFEYFLNASLIFKKSDKGGTKIVLETIESEKLTYTYKIINRERNRTETISCFIDAVDSDLIRQVRRLLGSGRDR